MESTLLTKAHHPVQILHGLPELDPSECVLDFIHRHHQLFKAIFYIPGTCDELVEVAELMLKEVLPTIAPADRVLVVLVGMEKLIRLPEELAKNPNTSIIIVHTLTTPPTSIASEVDSFLVRGCAIHTLMPLSHTHCTQRMVHSILSRTDLIPANEEQEVMSLLCDLTRGSPVLANITSEVVCAYCEGGGEGAIERLVTEVVRPSLIADRTEGNDLLAHVCILIGGLKLDRIEHLTLCTLAMYGPRPIPSTILAKVVNIILSALPNSRQNTVDRVVQQLLRRRLVRWHPGVVLMPTVSCVNKLYQIPQLVMDAALYGMEDADIVLAAGVAHKAIIGEIPHRDHIHATPTMMTSLYCVALSRGLIQTVTTFVSSGLVSLDLYTELYRPIAQIYG